MLLVRMSMGDKNVLLSDWYEASKKFILGSKEELNLIINEQIFKDTLKIIEGTFIKTDYKNEECVVAFQNPSVYDFLLAWISELADTQELIVRESYYVEQLFMAFSDKEYPSYFNYGRVIIKESVKPTLKQAFKRHLKDLHFCTLKECGKTYRKEQQGVIDFLLSFEHSYGDIYKTNPDLISDLMIQDLLEDTGTALFKRMDLLDKLGEDTKQTLDLERLARIVLEQAENLDDYVNSMDLLCETHFGSDALSSEVLLKKIEEALEVELEVADSEQACDQIKDCLSELAKYVPSLDESFWQDTIDGVISSFLHEVDYDEDFSRDLAPTQINSYDKYDEMFSSLLESNKDYNK